MCTVMFKLVLVSSYTLWPTLLTGNSVVMKFLEWYIGPNGITNGKC